MKVAKTFSLIVFHIFPLFIRCLLLNSRGRGLAALCRWITYPAILFIYDQTVHKALVWFSPSLFLSVAAVRADSEGDELSAGDVLLPASSQTQPGHALSIKRLKESVLVHVGPILTVWHQSRKPSLFIKYYPKSQGKLVQLYVFSNCFTF